MNTLPAPLWDVPACRVSADVVRTRPHPDHAQGGPAVMHADFDPALGAVIDVVREVYAPVGAAMADGRPVHPVEFGALAGAVGALLKALDARTSPAPVQALKAAA